MNHKISNFIAETLIELIDSKVSVELVQSVYLPDRNSGEFNDFPREFKVAMKRPLKYWFPIYIHEFCHFRQWKEKSVLWDKYDDTFFEWVDDRENFQLSEVKKSLKSIISLELDCEKRAVQMIKDRELPLDTDDYIKGANAYLLSYFISYEQMGWYASAPYEDKKVLDVVPDKFLKVKDYMKYNSTYHEKIKKHYTNKKI